MNNLWQDIRIKMLRSGSKIGLLIGINVFVYLLINISGTLENWFFRSNNIQQLAFTYLRMPADLSSLASHFWTPITYMFMHDGVLHILFNMLWLYWMGQIFEEFIGNRHTVMLYFLGGLAGAIFFVGSYNLIPYFISMNNGGAAIVGASAGVMAILVGTATLLPNYTLYLMFIGPVKLKWLAVFYVLLDFILSVGTNAGGEMAHLGGALIGYIYIKQLQRGNDWSKPFHNLFKSRPKLKVVSKGGSGDIQRGTPREDEVDRILDKISQSGFESLSKQEKDTLARASRSNDR